MEIGIRELRDGLSKHLALVRDGRTLTVTDHGHPIARIVPVDVPTRLERLAHSPFAFRILARPPVPAARPHRIPPRCA